MIDTGNRRIAESFYKALVVLAVLYGALVLASLAAVYF